jgi:hypothetical protein
VHHAALAVAFDPGLADEMLPRLRVQVTAAVEAFAERRVADKLTAVGVRYACVRREVREVRIYIHQVLRPRVAAAIS